MADGNSFSTVKIQLEILCNGDRRSCRTAIDTIYNICISAIGKYEKDNEETFRRFASTVLQGSIDCLHCDDQQEYCREKAARICQLFLNVPNDSADFDWEEFMDHFMSTCIRRLLPKSGTGSLMARPTEPSEEIRLLLVSSLNRLIGLSLGAMSSVKLEEHLENLCEAFGYTLHDPCPEIIIESCIGIGRLVSMKSMHFHEHSSKLLDDLMPCIIHQRANVRVAAIEAVGLTVLYGSNECPNKVYPVLAQRFLDQVPRVRKAVTGVIAGWMKSLPDHHLCYKWLIPLMLTGVLDEVSEVKDFAAEVWLSAGISFVEGNKSSLDAQLDFDEITSFIPFRDVARPSLGCRLLVTNNLQNIISAVYNDLRDWNPTVRRKTAELLYVLLIHAEDRMVSVLQNITDSLLVGCKDDDPKVVSEIMKCAEVVGYFVPADVWWNLIEHKVENRSSDILPYLGILEALISGCKSDDLSPVLINIVGRLSQPYVFCDFKEEQCSQLLAFVVSIFGVGVDCRCVVPQLFTVLLTCFALKPKDNEKILDAISCLRDMVHVDSNAELYALYVEQCFESLCNSEYEIWGHSNIEWIIFNLYVVELGIHLVPHVNKVLPYFITTLKTIKEDPEKLFLALRTVSELAANFGPVVELHSKVEDFFTSLISEFILPVLIWRPTSTMATLRAAALTSLLKIFKALNFSNEKVETFFNELMCRLLDNIEDDKVATRLIVCQIFGCCNGKFSLKFNAKNYLATGLALLKRLDDPAHDVRIIALDVLGNVLLSWLGSDDYEGTCNQNGILDICKCLMIYLDDSNESIQSSCSAILQEIANKEPEVQKVLLEKFDSNHCDQEFCSKLEELISRLKNA